MLKKGEKLKLKTLSVLSLFGLSLGVLSPSIFAMKPNSSVIKAGALSVKEVAEKSSVSKLKSS